MLELIKKVFNFKMLIVLLMGFSSGLPLLLVGSTLQAWMTELGIDMTSIGLVSLLGLPYVLKFLWAPLLDRYELPFLGRRRGWIFVSQLGLVLTLLLISFFNPKEHLWIVCALSFLISFFSATQDIVLDAYRREILTDEELGLGSTLNVNGYRIAMIVSGAFALFLAEKMSWSHVYQIMSLIMLFFMGVTIVARNEIVTEAKPSSMRLAITGPLMDFFKRDHSVILLLFILLYKVGDSMASNMTTPFILSVGYSKTDLATVAKTFGMLATISGGLIGGIVMLKMNIRYALFIFGILQALSTLGFTFLAGISPSLTALAFVIGFENLAAGMGTAAYSAYMASLTNKKFTATQFALLTALMGIPRVVLSSPTGWLSEQLGWAQFFVFCTFSALPGMFLLVLIFKLEKATEKTTL